MSLKISKTNILFAIFILFFSCSEKNKDPYPEFIIPVISNSYEVVTGFDDSIYGKSVSYFVQEKFPASDALKFYESFLIKKGFPKFEDYPHVDKTWVKFNWKTVRWDITADSPPARYFTAWIDGNRNLIFKLTLNYDKGDDKLSVTCFLHPYARQNLFVEFDKWVANEGKEKEFYEFLSKYTKPDRKVDIDRALKENQDNELIRKFAQASEQNKKYIATAYMAYKKSLNND